MFGQKELADLQLRKRALVLESDLNRLALQAEWQRVCAATGWISQATRFCRQANPWLVLLAPLAGLWTARTLHREGGIVSHLLAALKWIPSLMTIWRSFAGTQSEDDTPRPTAS
jgi:hypothetical protein